MFVFNLSVEIESALPKPIDLIEVRIRHKVLRERGGVAHTLQRTVHEARVANVVQPHNSWLDLQERGERMTEAKE
jgi:hypothetical protein